VISKVCAQQLPAKVLKRLTNRAAGYL
jgi:hypothetical protein